ncbi:MAG: flagellar hook-associated protein FlgL [Acidimicrobiales bacterium]
MRISTPQMWRSSINDVSRAQVASAEAGKRVSTGRRIDRASDDPVGALRATQLRTDADAIDQYHRAAQDAVTVMNEQDTALQSVLNRMIEVEGLTISSANDVQTVDGREAIATELEELRAQLVDIANTDHRGRALFGGFNGAAVDASAPTVALSSDGGAVLRRVDENHVVQINVDAGEVFGFSSGRSLFDVLDDIIIDVRAADVATLGTTRLDELESARTNVSNALGTIGARTSRVQTTITHSTERRDTNRAAAASIDEVDLAQASIDVSEAALAYEAALAITAQINRTSLLNFL